MKKDIHSEAVEKLFTAVMSLKNMEECYLFFEDICTVNELLSLSQRFDVGSRLLEKQTYQEISDAQDISLKTVYKYLHKAITKLHEHFNTQE